MAFFGSCCTVFILVSLTIWKPESNNFGMGAEVKHKLFSSMAECEQEIHKKHDLYNFGKLPGKMGSMILYNYPPYIMEKDPRPRFIWQQENRNRIWRLECRGMRGVTFEDK